jgi:hypothetical protein
MSETAVQLQKSSQPNVISPAVLTERTQKVIAKIEARLDAPLITYWNSPNGSICGSDVIGLYGILQQIGKVDHLYFSLSRKGDTARPRCAWCIFCGNT